MAQCRKSASAIVVMIEIQLVHLRVLRVLEPVHRRTMVVVVVVNWTLRVSTQSLLSMTGLDDLHLDGSFNENLAAHRFRDHERGD